jgi:hypothetical protein
MFATFDEGNKGYVTLEDFTSGVGKYNIEVDASRFFELSGATEKGLTYRQFEAALTGSSSGRQNWMGCPLHRDPDGQEHVRMAAIHTLCELVRAVKAADEGAF